YGRLLDSLDRTQTEERVELLYELGTTARRSGDLAGARTHLEEALKLNQSHARALSEMVFVLEGLGDHRGACAARTALIQTETDPDKRARGLVDVGQLWVRLGDRERAIGIFEEASRVVVQNRASLRALLELYQEMNRWDKVAEILERLIALETDPARR